MGDFVWEPHIYVTTTTGVIIHCRQYSDKPHVAGSKIQLEYGEKMANEWKSFKTFDKVEIFPYNVLLSFLEEGETNVVRVFNDSRQIFEFKGKEKVCVARLHPIVPWCLTRLL